MKNGITKKYRGVVISDLHFGAIDIDEMKKELNNNFFSIIEKKNYNYCIILGDYWDKKVYLNDRVSEIGVWFMEKLLRYIKTVRIIYGTESHEADQYHVLQPFCECDYYDVKIIYSVEQEELFPGINVLYIPEEYIKDKDEYYKDYFQNKYKYVFGHGIIAEAMTMIKREKTKTEGRLKPSVFTTADFKKIAGETYFGHYHVHTDLPGYIHYVGSFTRWQQGEEEEKGFYEICYKTSDDGSHFINEFHENYDAPKYKTYSFGYEHDLFSKNCDIEKETKTLINLVEISGAVKVHFIFNIPEDYDNPEFFINYMRETFRLDKRVTLDFVNGYIEKKKATNKETLTKILDKFDYLFDRNLTVGDIVNSFIKDKNGKVIGSDNINEFLHKDIMKLIEEELLKEEDTEEK